MESIIQFSLNTDDKAIIFLNLTWTIECARDTIVDKMTTLDIIFQHKATLAMYRGIIFCGIAIQIKIGQFTFEIIDTNHMWKGAIPTLAIKIMFMISPILNLD